MATIIGIKGCPRCDELKQMYPNASYIELPNISLGLGDTISKITSIFGINPCNGCRIRQYKLNKLVPYKWRIKKLDPRIARLKINICLLNKKSYPIYLPSENSDTILNLLDEA